MHLYNNSLVIMQVYATILYSLHAWVHPYVSTITSIALLTICIKIDACRPALHHNTAREMSYSYCVFILTEWFVENSYVPLIIEELKTIILQPFMTSMLQNKVALTLCVKE